MHDNNNIYGTYNLPGAESPYPRDFIVDADGIIRLAKHEYEPGTMIAVIESLLRDPAALVETSVPLNPPSPVLLSSFPNPFNPETRIKLSLTADSRVTLNLLDVRGRLLRVLIWNEIMRAGDHQIALQGSSLDSGVYFLQLVSGQETVIQKIVKLK